jgi:hypothetical protein
MKAFAAVPVAERKDHAIDWVAPMSDERWLITRPEERELLVVDGRLQPIWHLRLPSTWRGRHAVNEDLSLVALSLQDEVLLLTGEGREVARFAHPAWGWPAREGCCAFAPDQRYLWATVPTQDEGDELWLVDINQPSLLDRRLLDTLMEGCQPIYHPDGQTIGLSIGEGQDARRSAGRVPVAVRLNCDSRRASTGCWWTCIRPARSTSPCRTTVSRGMSWCGIVSSTMLPLTGSLHGTPFPLAASGTLLPGT